MLSEPTYAFTLPSIEDDTTLECRLYQPDNVPDPESKTFKAAVFAHPYAPLGGNFDDAAVLAVTETLLSHGYSVATFNFRGAGGSGRKTSWTGHDEKNDFETVVGFLLYYVHVLSSGHATIELLLGGYSYGSLVLNRLSEASAIVKRFQECEIGTAGSEVLLRARKVAEQTIITTEQEATSIARGRTLGVVESKHNQKHSPMTMGGEETNAAERRRSSKDARRSGEFVRKSLDVPHRIAHHLHHHGKRRSSADNLTQANTEKNTPTTPIKTGDKFEPKISTRYLLVSPVLMPFTTSLLPPGPPLSSPFHTTSSDSKGAGSQFLHNPTLAIFGSNDSFTSSKRLSAWATKQEKESSTSNFTWSQIEGGTHFWHEKVFKSQLQEKINQWLE